MSEAETLEQIRREQIICAQQIIKAIGQLACDLKATHPDYRPYEKIIRELPSP